MPLPDDPHHYSDHPESLLQHLIAFDTSNPPGNEAPCIESIRAILTSAGIESTIIAKDRKRPNLLARLRGRGTAAPLLMYGHVDVVPVTAQQWLHPPFEGTIAEGFVWGRGALDMKGGLAMMLSAMLRARREQLQPAGDVVMCIVSDEEAGGDFGARFLVEEHPSHFDGIRHAIGEFGGFTFHVGKRRCYPIMVAEKQTCVLKLTIRSDRSGHGAMPVRGGVMERLARLLQRLERKQLPPHITPVARLMVSRIAEALPLVARPFAHLVLNPAFTNTLMPLAGGLRRMLEPLLHHSVSATVVRGGEKVNVIPDSVELMLDGRLLPGYTPQDLIRELQPIMGDRVTIEVVRFDSGPAHINMELFDMLAGILNESDPEGVVIPMLLSAATDARFFSRLGIQTYGFLPMKLPAHFHFAETIHAANERMPVEALSFGTSAIYRLLQRFGNDDAISASSTPTKTPTDS